MRVPREKLTLRQRRRLKKHAHAVYASMLGETDEYRERINTWENAYVKGRILTLIVRYGVAFVTLAFLLLLAGVVLGPLTFDDLRSSLGTAAAVSLFLALVTAPLTRMKHDDAYQRTASLFVRVKSAENLTLFPFTKRARERRDARRRESESGSLVRAVERRIQIQPRLISTRASIIAGRRARGRPANPLGLPKGLASALDKLSPETPAVKIEKLFERKRVSDYLATGFRVQPRAERGRNYFLQSRGVRNAIRAGIVLWHLGAMMRDERRNNPGWRRSYITHPDEQVTVLKENEDMRLRFRTASPHLAWPDENDRTGEYETATHFVIQCVQNPMNLPVYLISVSDIVARIDDAIASNQGDQGADLAGLTREAVMARLLGNAPVMFSRWNTATLRPKEQTPNNQPILANLSEDPENPDYALRWDPNRIEWSSFDETDQELRHSFAVLLKAVELAGARAERVVLRRGDALVVDNLRCLVARREFCRGGAYSRLKYAMGIDPCWELTAFSGFRPVNMDQV